MTDSQSILYTASLIEYVGRITKNHRYDIAERIGRSGFRRLLRNACVNHCLSFEQVSDELIEYYQIENGTYETVENCRFRVPSHIAIGQVYTRLVEEVSASEQDYEDVFYKVMTSRFTDKLTNFNSSWFFAPPDELAYYYKQETSLASG